MVKFGKVLVNFSTSRPGPRCRWPVRRPARPACRTKVRRVPRSARRCARRSAAHPVLKVRGPSLASIYAAFNRAYRKLMAIQRKNNPSSRYKLLCSPEESERRWREDLARIYGENAVPAGETAAKEVYSRTVAAPIAKAAPRALASAPSAAQPQKVPRDITPVPLVRLPNGLLGLDYNAVRPS